MGAVCRSIYNEYLEAEYGSGTLRLKEYLNERNIPLSDLIAKADIDANTLRRYYTDSLKNVSLDILGKICYCLECNLCDILVYDSSAQKRKSKVKESNDNM